MRYYTFKNITGNVYFDIDVIKCDSTDDISGIGIKSKKTEFGFGDIISERRGISFNKIFELRM